MSSPEPAEQPAQPAGGDTPPRERMFNVPRVVLALAALLALIHLTIAYLLTVEQTNELLLMFAFAPFRYVVAVLPGEALLTGWGPKTWTFVTYAFLHADINHLVFNLVWLLAFGSPVAQRFGAARFLGFYLATAAAGALAYLAMRWNTPALMIGASAAVSGAMGAAIRFVFQRGGPLGLIGSGERESNLVPAAPLSVLLRDGRVLAFIAVWFGINLLFGVGAISIPGMGDGAVAWEAHIGGFVAGLLGFPLFDPARPAPPESESPPIVAPDDPVNRP